MTIINNKKKLNKEQLEAVRHGEGPLLIIAGAGTGKTTVITERIKWLIAKGKAQPSEILALTFTNKAALEMEERVDIALPYGYTQMWVTTFHAYGERILRQEAVHIGLDPGFHLMTEAESIIFFRKNLFQFSLNYFRPLGNPTKFIEGILQHFGRLKDEDISPSQYLDWVKSEIRNPKSEKEELEKYLELASAYKKYEELKVKEGMMDFSDLISNTLLLLRTKANILKAYQNQFQYILIDEFQDTNFAQNELAILLAGDKKNLTVVGDDDQAIYRWRGAAISNIIQFRKRFPEAKLAVLTGNYRSSKEILDSSYRLIQNNNPDRLEVNEKINKKLKSKRRIQGEKIEFLYFSRVEDEAEEIVNKIKDQRSKIKDKNGNELYSWKDFAILIRANNHADPIVRALSRAGIPYQFLGPSALYKAPEVKDLIAYLNILNDFTDSVSLFRVLSMPIFEMDIRDITAINNYAKRVNLSIFEAIETINAFEAKDENHWSSKSNHSKYLPNISEKSKGILVKFESMIKRHLSKIRTDTAGQILYYFLEDSGLLGKLVEYNNQKEEKIILNITKFFDRLKTYETQHDDASISAVCAFLEMSIELGESPLAANIDWTENDAVNILTVHASKGLEFPVVFLVNLVSQRFPTMARREQISIPDELVKEILPVGDYHLEEERRLFYVGLTRARDKVYLTASQFYAEGKKERKISPFVSETIGDKNLLIKSSESKQGNQLSLLDWKKQTEITTPIVRLPIGYLSYSQIETFTTCPLQYKYRYILKIPVPPSSAGSFGTSIHQTLQKFYEGLKRGEKLTRDDILKILETVWLPVGYSSRGHEEKMKKRGREMLELYFEKIFDPKIIPLNLEQLFNLRLSPSLKIGGKIDRVDKLDGEKIEIIDYKTGKRPTDKEIQENLQMTVYALAATDIGIYNKKPEDVILSFIFFDKCEKVSSTRTKEQLSAAKNKLMEKSMEIDQSKFEPKVSSLCDFCDFRMICEAW